MDTILPSEWPYVIGFVAIVLAVFWLIGRAADRGILVGPRPPAFIFTAALFFGIAALVDGLYGLWWRAAFYAFGCLYFAYTAWRQQRQRG